MDNPTLTKLASTLIWTGLLLLSQLFGYSSPPFDQQTIDQVLGISTSANLPDDYYLMDQIVDGDTIKVTIGDRIETVRLVGIDTPETKDPRKPVQCFGQQATDFLTSLLAGQPVKLEPDSLQGDRDRYGRLLRYVYLEDGTSVNATLVAQGFAFAYTPIDSDRLEEYKDLERQARLDNLGLWQACNP